ncbi:MAG: serine O-acetyltransferase EpsC [Bacteroidales bacterium]
MKQQLTLEQTISELSADKDQSVFYTSKRNESPMPDIARLSELVILLNKIIFPGFYGESSITPENLKFYIGVYTDQLHNLLIEQISRGLSFDSGIENRHIDYTPEAERITIEFISKLPEIKRLLRTDIEATFLGDPAAKSRGEIIYCYPGIKAISNYRISHELVKLKVPLIPRIISEMAHSATGIDINPGATIGEYFSIDHGTGIVIGETCRIGNNVKIYQGVTLGAKSFPLDENGNPIKGIDRHPIVEDNVIIYSGATILGRVTIGHDSVIGGNVWLTRNIPPGSKIMQKKPRENLYSDGGGI